MTTFDQETMQAIQRGVDTMIERHKAGQSERSRQQRWDLGIGEVREVEAALQVARERFPEDDGEGHRVKRIVEDELDQAKRELLELEAPNVEALSIKMAAFVETEGDFLCGTTGETLQRIFADVERLLVAPSH